MQIKLTEELYKKFCLMSEDNKKKFILYLIKNDYNAYLDLIFKEGTKNDHSTR
jgi:hypothetical protein